MATKNSKIKYLFPSAPKLLLVRPDAIGDVVLMIPLINTLKAAFPNARIMTLQQSYTKALLDNHPHIDEVILDWKKAGKVTSLKDMRRYAAYLRSYQFDAVLFSYLDPFYALLMTMARIPVRIGDGNKILLRPFLTHPVRQTFRNLVRHETEQNLELLKALNAPFTAETRMDVHVTPADHQKVTELLEKTNWNHEPLIGIHVSTGGGNRAWLPQRYAAFMDLIHTRTPYKVVLTGAGKKDLDLVDAIMAAAATTPLNLAGKTSLPELKALISRCAAFVGADTGPVHIAAALKVPVLCISPTKFVKSLRWGPWQTQNRIVGNPSQCPYVCNPYKCKEPDCLEAISPEYALKELLELLEDKMAVTDNQNKNRWFKASVNVGLVVETLDPSLLKETVTLVERLKSDGLRYRIICRNMRVKNTLSALLPEEEITHIPKHRLRALIRYICVKDLTIIQLVPGKKVFFWQWIVRQLSALNMYCPPVIVPAFPSSVSVIEAYREHFEALS